MPTVIDQVALDGEASRRLPDRSHKNRRVTRVLSACQCCKDGPRAKRKFSQQGLTCFSQHLAVVPCRAHHDDQGPGPSVALLERQSPFDRLHVDEVHLELNVDQDARRQAGLTQLQVAAAAGTSQMEISRIERGASAHGPAETLCRIAAVVGLRLSMELYPEGPAVRDAAQLSGLATLRFRAHNSFVWRHEVPVTNDPDDRRAWDAELSRPGVLIHVEFEVNLVDMQAVERRLTLKKRDGRPGSLIVVVRSTRQTANVRTQTHGVSNGQAGGSASVATVVRRPNVDSTNVWRLESPAAGLRRKIQGGSLVVRNAGRLRPTGSLAIAVPRFAAYRPGSACGLMPHLVCGYGNASDHGPPPCLSSEGELARNSGPTRHAESKRPARMRRPFGRTRVVPLPQGAARSIRQASWPGGAAWRPCARG